MQRGISSARPARRDLFVRLGCMLFSAYAGTAFDSMLGGTWPPRPDALNPMILFGAIAGAVMTPPAQALLVVNLALCFIFMCTRVPLWSCVVIALGFAAMDHVVLAAWTVR